MRPFRPGAASVLAALTLLFAAAPAPAEEKMLFDISLEESIKQAAANNFDVELRRVDADAARENRILAESEFDPALEAEAAYRKSRTASTSAFASPEVSENDTASAETSVSKKIETGMEARMGVTGRQDHTNSAYESLNPSYNTSIELELSQPLLKDMGKEINTWRIRTGLNNEQAAKNRLHAALSDVITSVRETYWELVFRARNLEAQRESLERARDLENRVRVQVDVGALSPLEIVQAQASVAERERLVIESDNAVDRVGDQLLKLLNPPSGDRIWENRLNPTDVPPARFPAVDMEGSVREALGRRPEVTAARKEMENRKIELVYRENQEWPSLDIVASLSLNGVRGEGQPVTSFTEGRTQVSSFAGGWDDTFRDAASGGYYDYLVGLRFSYPLGARGAKAQAAIAALDLQTALIKLQELEKEIILEVRDAVREIENGKKRIEAAKSARVLAEKRLEAEIRKFEVGASTSFNVLEYQKDLTVQQTEELRAMAESRKAVARYYRATGRALEEGGMELD
ncbi:MAG: TolC family protein [Candidatus Nitrospinota bacterium M3_3B_026]